MASPVLALRVSSDEEEYKRFLLSRVRSIRSDPLHSAAYLTNFAHFLKRSSQEFAKHGILPSTLRPAPTLQATSIRRPFVYSYKLRDGAQPVLTTFDDVEYYKKSRPRGVYRDDCNELVILTGRPSADWLCAIGARYNLDHRVFHQHMSFLPTGQRDWHAIPTLPSRSQNVLRVCVPSILFVGEHRFVDINSLQKARTDCDRQLRQSFRFIQHGTSTEAGRSIVRRMNIHSGDSFVIEQELSACLVKHGSDNWTVLVWMDAGQDSDLDFLPTPATDEFRGATDRLEFCPVFFEKDLAVDHCPVETRVPDSRPRQPFASLPGNYGCTMDWSKASKDPFRTIEEFLTFYAASEVQYINMLERFIEEQITYVESAQTKTNISAILHFDYAKSILIRHQAGVHGLRQSLDQGLGDWKLASNGDKVSDEGQLTTLNPDLDYLSIRIQNAIALCEAGKSTIMSNKSIEETQQSNEQAALVTQLTKVTNRLTFIFLPISFVTSVFGMNFVQFGQGSLSIWWWVAVTLPLLAASIILVERGSYLKNGLKTCWMGLHGILHERK